MTGQKQTRPIGRHGGKRTVSQHTRADGNTQTANRVGGKFDDKSGESDSAAVDVFDEEVDGDELDYDDDAMEVGESRPSVWVPQDPTSQMFDADETPDRVGYLLSLGEVSGDVTRVWSGSALSDDYEYTLTGPGGNSITDTMSNHPGATEGTPTLNWVMEGLAEGAQRHATGDYSDFEGASNLDEVKRIDKVASDKLRDLVGENRMQLYISGDKLREHLDFGDANDRASKQVAESFRQQLLLNGGLSEQGETMMAQAVEQGWRIPELTDGIPADATITEPERTWDSSDINARYQKELDGEAGASFDRVLGAGTWSKLPENDREELLQSLWDFTEPDAATAIRKNMEGRA